MFGVDEIFWFSKNALFYQKLQKNIYNVTTVCNLFKQDLTLCVAFLSNTKNDEK